MGTLTEDAVNVMLTNLTVRITLSSRTETAGKRPRGVFSCNEAEETAGTLYFKCTVMSHQQIIKALEAKINFGKVSSATPFSLISYH